MPLESRFRQFEPRIAALPIVNPRETSLMRYRSASSERSPGRVAATAWTPLADISPMLIAAAVKGEDPRFFEHHGVDWRALRLVARASLRARTVIAGASTITQQLARNLYLTPTRSISRKLVEIWLALRIEAVVSKPRILELYLNVIEWGPGLWGCTAAADAYFGKRPRELDLFESTFLVSLLPAPRATLCGRNAARVERAQLSLAFRLFLSGLVDGEACAICGHRVWQLRDRLLDGVLLRETLTSTADAASRASGADGALLRDVAEQLGITPIPPGELLKSRYGYDQQRAAFSRLCARFGKEALADVMTSGSYRAFRTDPARASHS